MEPRDRSQALIDEDPWRDMKWTRKTMLIIVGIGFITLALYTIASTATVAEASGFFGLAGLLAGASFLVGTFGGFLFGIPRTLQHNLRVSPLASQDGEGTKDAAATDAGAEDEERYQVNTNLEQISDWLTKILVGVGLTELRRLPALFDRFTRAVIAGNPVVPGRANFTQTIVGTIVVFFSVNGFLAGYLLTRLYLAGAFSRADRLLQFVKGKISELVELDLRLEDLSSGEKDLLAKVINAHEAGAAYVLPDTFKRGSPEHAYLKSLQERFLVKPTQSGRWHPGKGVDITPIGQQILDRLKEIVVQKNG